MTKDIKKRALRAATHTLVIHQRGAEREMQQSLTPVFISRHSQMHHFWLDGTTRVKHKLTLQIFKNGTWWKIQVVWIEQWPLKPGAVPFNQKMLQDWYSYSSSAEGLSSSLSVRPVTSKTCITDDWLIFFKWSSRRSCRHLQTRQRWGHQGLHFKPSYSEV